MSVSVFELYMAELRGNYQWNVKDELLRTGLAGPSGPPWSFDRLRMRAERVARR